MFLNFLPFIRYIFKSILEFELFLKSLLLLNIDFGVMGDSFIIQWVYFQMIHGDLYVSC